VAQPSSRAPPPSSPTHTLACLLPRPCTHSHRTHLLPPCAHVPTTGLGGTAILAGAFPFIARTHSGLLLIVAALGSLSAIAFSASYQVGCN
jgi:hypothetical protein